MERKIIKPNTKGLFLFIFTIYFAISAIIIILDKTNVEQINLKAFLIGSAIYWIWCISLLLIIKSQRIILEEDGIFRYRTLGINRCMFHSEQLTEIIKEKMNGHPVYVFKHMGNRKRKPIPFLPFEQKWEEIIQWLRTYNPNFTYDAKTPFYRHTYKKYDYVEKSPRT